MPSLSCFGWLSPVATPIAATLFGAFLIATAPAHAETSVEQAAQTIAGIGPEGAGYAEARQASERLRNASSTDVFAILEAMRITEVGKPNPAVANNWLRGLAADLVQASGLPETSLVEGYLNDTDNSPVGRAVALQLLQQADGAIAKRWIDTHLEDPSLLIREVTVASAIQRTKQIDNPDKKQEALRQVLTAARHPKQVTAVLGELKNMGDNISEADAFAMVAVWQSIGPFDNRNGIGFDQVYPPEAKFSANGEVDLNATYDGKNETTVNWQDVTASGNQGLVDLAALYDKEKGAVAYVYMEFEAQKGQSAQARLGCICANKIWVNGQLVASNEVYHAGTMIDQYIADCDLIKGTNRVLLKICQNEQTQSWAQDWDFRFRLTDRTGRGLTSETR